MQIALQTLVLFYLAFAAKHYCCDFLFQTSWMARGKGAVANWAKPLFVHAGVHGLGTGLIVLAGSPGFWWLALVDVGIHAAIDRTKGVAARKLLPTQHVFWLALGLDQLAHQLTHFAFILFLLTR